MFGILQFSKEIVGAVNTVPPLPVKHKGLVFGMLQFNKDICISGVKVSAERKGIAIKKNKKKATNKKDLSDKLTPRGVNAFTISFLSWLFMRITHYAIIA